MLHTGFHYLINDCRAAAIFSFLLFCLLSFASSIHTKWKIQSSQQNHPYFSPTFPTCFHFHTLNEIFRAARVQRHCSKYPLARRTRNGPLAGRRSTMASVRRKMRKGTATRSLVSSDLQPPATVCVEQLVPILLLGVFFYRDRDKVNTSSWDKVAPGPSNCWCPLTENRRK